VARAVAQEATARAPVPIGAPEIAAPVFVRSVFAGYFLRFGAFAVVLVLLPVLASGGGPPASAMLIVCGAYLTIYDLAVATNWRGTASCLVRRLCEVAAQGTIPRLLRPLLGTVMPYSAELDRQTAWGVVWTAGGIACMAIGVFRLLQS
jgi:hypothetical protein